MTAVVAAMFAAILIFMFMVMRAATAEFGDLLVLGVVSVALVVVGGLNALDTYLAQRRRD